MKSRYADIRALGNRFKSLYAIEEEAYRQAIDDVIRLLDSKRRDPALIRLLRAVAEYSEYIELEYKDGRRSVIELSEEEIDSIFRDLEVEKIKIRL